MFRKLIFYLISAIFLVSCGGTTVKVRQSSDGVNAQISVTTNNPTSVQVTPSIDVKLEDLLPVIDSLSSVVDTPLSFNDDGEMILNFNSDLCRLKSPQMQTAGYYTIALNSISSSFLKNANLSRIYSSMNVNKLKMHN